MIHKKMEVLNQSDIISKEIYDYALVIIETLKTQSFDITSDKAQVFMTHLAMATARQQKGESMNKMEQFILDDLMSQPQFEDAQIISDAMLENAPVAFTAAEKDYVYLHMCNLLAEKQGA